VYLGSGDKNDLTVNRIVATITGVLMAIVISYLPPHVNGRDPKHAREYLNALSEAFRLLLETFANESEGSKVTTGEFKKSLLSSADSKKAFAVFALNDADMMQGLPFMKVNEKLRPMLDSLGVTEASIKHLLDGFTYVIKNNYNVIETRTSVKAFIQDNLDEKGMLPESEPHPNVRVDVTIGWTYDIAYQLWKASQALDRMETEYKLCCNMY